MRKCISCSQPLPEGRETPEYFAQVGEGLTPDDLMGHADDLDLLMNFTRALFDALHQLTGLPDSYLSEDRDEAVRQLSRLGWELVKEVERRIYGLFKAGALWKERAQTCEKKGGENHAA
jgi:hypothetical protein